MTFPEPEIGLVIRMVYLWRREYDEGRDEGAKDRPCVILSSAQTGRVFVLPITHTIPAKDRAAIELPASLKAHLGLDSERSWIIVDECNSFDWPGYDLRPNIEGRIHYGHLPPRLFEKVRLAASEQIRSARLKVTRRD